MATQQVNVPKGEWTLISTSNIMFQCQENQCRITESATIPTDVNHPAKIGIPNEIYYFYNDDGNLYAYSKNGASIVFEPIV